jgi:hypothetical protein
MFDEVVSTFAKLRSHDARRYLLVVTPDRHLASEKLRRVLPDAARVVSADLPAVNGLLNAADVAIMLRRPSPINRVALPTKFGEYALTGLPVVMTEAVPEAAAIAREIGNRAVLENGGVTLPAPFDRASVAERAKARLGRRTALLQYRRLYGSGAFNAS